jgi:hypothetical protein
MRRLVPATALAALLFFLFSPSAGSFPTGFTLNFTSADIGDGANQTDLLTATLVGDDCDGDLRIALYRPDTSLVTDNGNGGVVGATQIQLTNPGQLVDTPGTYSVGVTCGGDIVGAQVPFEVFAEAVVPTTTVPPTPPTTVPPTDVDPVDASPAFTG